MNLHKCINPLSCGGGGTDAAGVAVGARSWIEVAAALATTTLVGSAWSASPPTVTIAEGRNSIVSAGQSFQALPGVRLGGCDLLRTGPGAFMQIEFEDGAAIATGQEGSGLVADVPSGPGPGPRLHALLSGWAKLSVPETAGQAPHQLSTPRFDVTVEHGVAVAHVDERGGELFVERGSVRVQSPSDATREVSLAAGRFLTSSGAARDFTIARAPSPAFLAAMPPAFRDTLPLRLKTFQARETARVPSGSNTAPAPVAMPPLPALDVCLDDTPLRQVQRALQRLGFELGVADGIAGPRTEAALRAFQTQRGLRPTGEADEATLRALGITERR